MVKQTHQYYFYRGEVIERFATGWCLEYELCNGSDTGIPIYRTLMDAKQAIRKRMDSTNTAEPRIIATAGWS